MNRNCDRCGNAKDFIFNPCRGCYFIYTFIPGFNPGLFGLKPFGLSSCEVTGFLFFRLRSCSVSADREHGLQIMIALTKSKIILAIIKIAS